MMRICFATAEYAPLAVVGGLGSASTGLVNELRAMGHEVIVAIPDYGDVELDDQHIAALPTPSWAGVMHARTGDHPTAGRITLVGNEAMKRPHPYTAANGDGWLDNDQRFIAFSAAVAVIANELRPDVVHLNDWHTSAACAFLDPSIPTVLTIHNLAYQGAADHGWLQQLGARASAYDHGGACNPLAGGIRLANAIVVVSPNYRREILEVENACGLHDVLTERVDDIVGIRNGIETDVWDPRNDPLIDLHFDCDNLENKAALRQQLRSELGLSTVSKSTSLSVVLSRLVHQKGSDIIDELIPLLEGVPTQLAILGSGETQLADRLRAAQRDHEGRVVFVDGYELGLGHRLISAGDLLIMPSRFEPCGLTQMQAMQYGTIPVVTGVGGLIDTVIDADDDRTRGTGFISRTVDAKGVVDAWHRAQRAWSNPRRRESIQRREMTTDWSWREPASQHVELYQRLC